MIALRIKRSAATATQAGQALALLEEQPGIYFGVDAGIHGLHPLQATLLTGPALALHLYGDGVEVEVRTGFGQRLLAQPALASWQAGLTRGSGACTLAALRGFLACFAPSPDVLLLGALPFAAHRLAAGDKWADSLGVLFFGEQLYRRDAAGAWQLLHLSLAGAAEGDAAAPSAAVAGPESSTPDPQDDHPPGGYADMVRRALPCLEGSALVSLTLSQSYRRRVKMPAVQAFERLRAANPAPASFFVNDGSGQRLFGASPDLQLVISSGTVQSLPVCGTVARRPGATGEAESLRELLNEEVDAASLAVCTDALRNDLAPLCAPGSLQLLNRRHPMSLATVVHAVDRIEGKLREGVDAWDAIAATAAPVMVTGTPRRQALKAIAQLEASPRGWYGGLVVQVASNGDALAGTILRAAAVNNGVAEVRTGGDLMADSSPEREEQESRLKTRSLWRAFGLETVAGPEGVPDNITAPGQVRLIDAADPFAESMRDCLLGLGMALSADATCALLLGPDEVPDGQPQHLVAVGDAALRLLGRSGWRVCASRPEHGRTLRCQATAAAPWTHAGEFTAARYASYALQAGDTPSGWQTWALDTQGQPVALAHAGRRLVCLLFRPDSMLSDPQARQVLRAALAFAGAPVANTEG
ncbi:chorismate-binding protein [Polaromonas sp.]|uniref:chorismate-binding protein n=1 Tax=Polaromonas sp. TaxID=1869339 RepID=UPI003752519C